MTRKGFLALVVLPFLGKKREVVPPVAKALAKAGIAAIKAMQRQIAASGGTTTVKGSDLYLAMKKWERQLKKLN